LTVTYLFSPSASLPGRSLGSTAVVTPEEHVLGVVVARGEGRGKPGRMLRLMRGRAGVW
jgi:hypothetical protein